MGSKMPILPKVLRQEHHKGGIHASATNLTGFLFFRCRAIQSRGSKGDHKKTKTIYSSEKIGRASCWGKVYIKVVGV